MRLVFVLACALTACGNAFTSVDVRDAGGTDAGEDVAVTDSGSGDTSTGATFCSNQKVAFCDDFDDGDVEDDWDDTLLVAGGEVTAGTTFVSAPGSAAMKVPPTVNVAEYARARLLKTSQAQPWTALRLAFELRIDELPPFPDYSPQVSVASILVPGVAGFALGFGVDGTFLLYTNERETPIQRHPIAQEKPQSGTWASYVVDVTRSPGEIRIEVTKNNRKLPSDLRVPLTTANALPLSVLVGASSRHASTAFAMTVDNVTFDVAR